jgi:hypothetical protein
MAISTRPQRAGLRAAFDGEKAAEAAYALGSLKRPAHYRPRATVQSFFKPETRVGGHWRSPSATTASTVCFSPYSTF